MRRARTAPSPSAATRSPPPDLPLKPSRYRFGVAKRVRAPLAAWIACAGALVLLALVAYGIDAAQRADATLLTKFIAREGSVGSLADVIAHLADPLPLLALLAAACGIALWRGRPLDALAAVV